MNGFFRYPGGKSKIKNHILTRLKSCSDYIEPFFGGGSIGLNYLINNKEIKSFHINDFDFGIYAIWRTISNRPDLLKNKVLNFQPNINSYYKYKNDLLINRKSDSDVVVANIAFKKLAIHQISYSGLGVKSGGPQGGEEQSSNYKIDCRWSPKYICEKIDEIHNMFKKVTNLKITYDSYQDILKNCSLDSAIYLDPPYYKKGNDLYQFGFSHQQHIELSEILKSTDNKNWVLSYDDCEEIRNLYSWAKISEIENINTITNAKCKNTGERKGVLKKELIITYV
jgi:DNA adenine methylase